MLNDLERRDEITRSANQLEKSGAARTIRLPVPSNAARLEPRLKPGRRPLQLLGRHACRTVASVWVAGVVAAAGLVYLWGCLSSIPMYCVVVVLAVMFGS